MTDEKTNYKLLYLKSVNKDIKKPIKEKTWYRAKQLSEYLGCGVSTVWWLAKNKDGFPQPKKLTPNLSIWDIKKVDEYLNSL